MGTNKSKLISYYAMRQLIGVLNILLPFLCWGINAFINNLNILKNSFFVDKANTLNYNPGDNLKSSISHFYYTSSGPLFTGILITVSVFLFCYVGYKRNKKEDRYSWITDNGITNFAAICALGIVVFPTASEHEITDNIHIFVSSKFVGWLHFGSAALFFMSTAILSIVNFRRNPSKKLINGTEGKLFLICGWGIILSLVIIAISIGFMNGREWFSGKFVYIMEVVMLLFFGIAWLVKGKSRLTQQLLKH